MKHTLTAVALLLATASQASFYTGEQLMQDLEKEGKTEAAVAQGYVIGVFDINDHVAHCVPKGVPTFDLVTAVHRYLRQNPQVRQLQGDLLVTMYLSSKYPCSRPAKAS